jgi:hypothetical protein
MDEYHRELGQYLLTQLDENVMVLRRFLPTEPGWYWRRSRDKHDFDEMEIVKVRWYGDQLAVGNCFLEGCLTYEKSEWAGPIPFPCDA